MRSNISAPALRRHRHSLVDVANVIDSGDERWIDGVNFTPRGCNVLYGHDTGCWAPREDKGLQGCSPVAEFYPYVIEATVAWSTLDLNADPKAILTESLEVGTSAVLERLIEMAIDPITGPIPPVTVSGTVAPGGIAGRAANPAIINPHLEDGIDVPVGTGTSNAAAAVDGLGRLESKLVDASDHIGGAGTIYMSPRYAILAGEALYSDNGGLFTKATGSQVVVGNFGAFEGKTIYGHPGDVDVYLSDIGDITEVIDRASNELIIQAERYAVAVWNTCAVFKGGID